MRKVRFIVQAEFLGGYSLIESFDIPDFPIKKIIEEILDELSKKFHSSITKLILDSSGKFGHKKENFPKDIDYTEVFKIKILGWSFF